MFNKTIRVINYFSEKFGIHFTDFNDPNLPRIPKESSKYLKGLVEANGYVESDTPCANGP